MNNKIIVSAALLGTVAIILGAFGAHALKKVLTVEELITFETGVRYQMYHALFLLFIGINQNLSQKATNRIYTLTLAGVFLFSGSIYLLATKNLTSIDFGKIGFLTPIGGTLLISAWLVLLFDFLKNNKS